MVSNDKELDDKMAVETSAEKNEPEITLSPRVQQAIGQSLIAHYNDIVSAPIPDRFLALLAELEAKEKSRDN